MAGTMELARYGPYQCDHLFLLIGANPLPNYVAARLLTRPGGQLHLLASSREGQVGGTVRVAESILHQLPDRTGRIMSLADVSDARRIERELEEYVQGLGIPAGSRVGLHYTGGTKPMSVHSHETLQRWCAGCGLTYQFSYLDPRQLAFRFANGIKEPIRPEDFTDPPFSLAALVELHGWQIEECDDEPVLPDLCHRLAHGLGSDLDKFKEWRQWCDWNIRTWSGPNQWARYDWPGFKEANASSALVSWLEEDLGNMKAVETLLQWVQTNQLRSKSAELATIRPPAILSDAPTLADVLAQLAPDIDWPDNNRRLGRLSAFLDGFWLENYVLGCIINIRNAFEEANEEQLHPIQEVYRGLKVTRAGTNATEFELDVAALKGYQLFAISCTTSLVKEQNKKRLFEAYTRARQMGGDEARVALIGGYANTALLLQEVNEEWLAPQDVIRVFGPQDWPALETKLAEWFNWQPV